ncbi:MAG TPA: hypothetical protein VGB15_11410 [Longimicrobium sp.]|jgi:hypothetical protein
MSTENQEALKVSIAAAAPPAVELAVVSPLSPTRQTVQDEDGNNSALQLATSSAAVGTSSAPAAFQAFPASSDENGTGFVIGNTANTNLRIGFNLTGGYSWIQSHGSKPLHINTIGNNVSIARPGARVGIGTKTPNDTLEVNGSLRVTGLPVATAANFPTLKQVYVDAAGVFYRWP